MEFEENERVYVKSREAYGEYVGEADESEKILVDLDKENPYKGIIEVEKELVEKA